MSCSWLQQRIKRYRYIVSPLCDSLLEERNEIEKGPNCVARSVLASLLAARAPSAEVSLSVQPHQGKPATPNVCKAVLGGRRRNKFIPALCVLVHLSTILLRISCRDFVQMVSFGHNIVHFQAIRLVLLRHSDLQVKGSLQYAQLTLLLVLGLNSRPSGQP